MRKAQTALKPLTGPNDPRHGTQCGYGYWGCRCAKCRAAATERAREARQTVTVTNHGRYGYDMGCRCDECSTAKRASEKARRDAKREWKRTRKPQAIAKADLSKLA